MVRRLSPFRPTLSTPRGRRERRKAPLRSGVAARFVSLGVCFRSRGVPPIAPADPQ